MSTYKPYLVIYGVWHPPLGQAQADIPARLFTHFNRDVKNPAGRGMGIPVYFRSEAASGSSVPLPLDLDRAQHSVVVVLVTSDMVIDNNWETYVRAIHDQAVNSANHRLFPVSLSAPAARFEEGVGNTQFIHYHEFPVAPTEQLLIRLTHEICRLLQDRPRSNDVTNSSPPAAGSQKPSARRRLEPIKLFISHAKKDGLELAKGIKAQVESTPLGRFFDAIEIPPGEDFTTEIEDAIKESAVLAIKTDAYSSRPWCRREALTAKRFGRPLVILDALEKGEDRVFPGLANVPSLRWTGSNDQAVLDLALNDVLHQFYLTGRMDTLQQAGRIPKNAVILTRPPELFDYSRIRPSATLGANPVVVYPDPPLGREEMVVLAGAFPGVAFRTPMVPPVQERFLKGWTIGISVGNSPDLGPRGFGEDHLQDAMAEIARYLLAEGARIAYGGDLRPGGFTLALFDLVRAYNDIGTTAPWERVADHLHWPFFLTLDADSRAALNQVAVLHSVDPPNDLAGSFSQVDWKAPLKPDSPQNGYIWARCLTKMREEMNAAIDVRVVLGGKVTNFTGKYPGIAEEAALALRAGKPLFVLGAFGGCAQVVIDAIDKDQSPALDKDYQTGSTANYADLIAQYEEHAGTRDLTGSEPTRIDFGQLITTLHGPDLRATDPKAQGIARLKNGLDEAENRRLFTTVDLEEAISLILVGLSRLPVPSPRKGVGDQQGEP